ncbi:MAG: hypothetical protein ABIO94_05095 [Opitutaceae bacterium]
MNQHPEEENLLDDVLAEAAPADFRAALLADTLRLASHRRRSRQIRRGVGAATALALGIFLSWRGLSPPSASIELYESVRTHPLAESALVRTHSFDGEVHTGSQPTVATIRTAAEREGFRFVDDDELLALAWPRPAALVRIGPEMQTLIFLPQAELEGGPLN